MPFDVVPLKMTPKEFMTEIIIRYFVREYKAKEYCLRQIPYNMLRKFYDAFQRRKVRSRHGAFR